MSTAPSPVRASRPSPTRLWGRHTWLSRLPLVGGWLDRWLRRRQEVRRKEVERQRFPAFKPDVEALEQRWSPDTVVDVLQVPFVAGGAVLMSGALATPAAVLAHGWSGGHPFLLPPLPEPEHSEPPA